MKIKKILSIILSLLLLFATITSSLALAEESPYGDDEYLYSFYWSLDERTVDVYKNGDFGYFIHHDIVYIVRYYGQEKVINIPEKIHGFSVYEIYRLRASNQDKIEEIYVPSSVEEINSMAEFPNLKKVHFAENSQLRSINFRALSNNPSLIEISFPNSLEYLGDQVLMNCRSLKEIVIPENCVKIGWRPFEDCVSLKKITIKGEKIGYYIPDEVHWECTIYRENRIPPGFAHGCTSLKSINIPESVKVIDEGAFENSGLESITIPKNVKTIYRDAFKGCENLTSVKFAGKVNNIGRSAFSKCVNLKTVNFTKGYLKKVYDYAFYKCEKLDKITISNTKNVPTIAKSAFNKAKSGIKFYVKNNTVAKKLKAKLQKTNIKKAKIYRSAPILIYKNVG